MIAIDPIKAPFFKENEEKQTILSLLFSIIILLCPIIFVLALKKLSSSKSLNKMLILSEVLT